MNYEDDIRIDEGALDVEWLEQPGLMMKYTRVSAQMRMESDLAKERLDVVRAQIDKEIRENPEKFGIEKITETVVLNTIVVDLRYRQKNKEYLEAKYEAELAMGAVRAFEQRKEALENLVRLHGTQYFAGPKMPRDITEEAQKRSNKLVKTAVRRTK